MKRFLIVGLLTPLVACSDVMDERYATWADAQRAGAIERGWVPEFVPASAREISDTHNLDTNAQTLEFIVHPSEVSVMAKGLRAISDADATAAAKLSKDSGLAGAPDVATYVVCSKPLNGALLVYRKSGRAVYKTPVEWAEDDCSPDA